MQKNCSDCETVKPFEAFYRRHRHGKYEYSKAGYANICIPCHKLYNKERKTKDPQKSKDIDTNSRFKRSYGIDLDQYNQLLKAQDHKCLGCDRHETEFTKKLVVDHCHSSGNVRGLLCTPCNLILGYAHDNTKVLQNLITYLSPESAAKTDMLINQSAKKAGYLYR